MNSYLYKNSYCYIFSEMHVGMYVLFIVSFIYWVNIIVNTNYKKMAEKYQNYSGNYEFFDYEYLVTIIL